MSQSNKSVILGEPNDFGRGPWFDGLTTLSEVEGESRRIVQYQLVLDPPPKAAGDDELRYHLQ